MLRTWDYAWWKPVIGFLLLLAGGLVVMPLLLLPVLFVVVVLQGGDGDVLTRFTDALSLESVTPASMLYLNLSLASLTVLAMLIMRFVHRLRPRWLSSVLPGIRWGFLAACVGLSVVALVASLVVGSLLPSDPSGVSGSPHLPTGQLLVTSVVILLTTPLQALGEEYAFRGYLMQAVGSLTRSRVVAVVVTSVLFALAHGVQNFPLFFDRLAFGMMAGAVVVLVGGLEAGIALHVLNNLLAFGVAIAFGQLDSTLTVTEVSWWQLPLTIVQNGVYLVLVLVVARGMRLRTTSAPPPPPAVQQAGQGAPAPTR
jgi:membrane protease YdiL (CAAX protease family)